MKKLRKNRGFTMTELITVIVILGILAAVAAPRFFDRGTFDSRGFYDQTISTLRYAQRAAISQRRFVCAQFSAVDLIPGTVTLTTGPTNSCGTPLTGPAGQATYVITSNNANFSVSPAGLGISFDCLGRPRSVGEGVICSNTAGILTTPTTITINGYGTSIIVERETGYVH